MSQCTTIRLLTYTCVCVREECAKGVTNLLTHLCVCVRGECALPTLRIGYTYPIDSQELSFVTPKELQPLRGLRD